MSRHALSLTINGERYDAEIPAGMSLLELLREALLELVQAEPFAPIHVRRRG